MVDPASTTTTGHTAGSSVLEASRPATPSAAPATPEVRPFPARLHTPALAVAALLAVLVPLLATLDLDLPGRAALAAAYVLLVPGVPLALALRLPDPLVTTALAIASSLAVWLIYGTATIVGGWWEPVNGAWCVTLLALVLSVVAIRRARPWESAPTTTPATGAERLSRLLLLALVAVTALLWWWSTQHLALDRAAVLGLLPVAGWRYGLALLLAGGLTAYGLLRGRVDHLLLACCAVLVALIGYGTVPVGDGAGSVPVGWVHVAFAQYIFDYGTVPAGVDARFSWPGFFSAGAQLNALAGTADLRGFLVLASVVYSVAAIPALLVIARVITRSWRWSWVAVFIYLFTNWYQQDYFSPQASAFVIYTALLATLLWLVSESASPVAGGSVLSRVRRAVTRLPALPAGVRPADARRLGLVLALLVTAVIVGHQLTPITLIFALLVFTVTGHIRYRMLWFFGAVVFAGWFSYGATDFWLGHLDTIFGDLGRVSNSVGAGVSNRLVGDPVYQDAQFVRIAWSLALFLAAAIGILLLLLRRRSDVWLVAGLGAAPFGLLAVQSYGGETVIRSFLYASPVLAPLAALALQALEGQLTRLRPATFDRVWGRALLVVPAVVVAALLLTFTRGLNVSFERTPPVQVAASEVLRDRVRPGDAVGLPTALGLTPGLDLTANKTTYLDLEACNGGDLDGCLGDERPRFVLLTLTQERYGELLESRPSGWVWSLGERLTQSGAYQVIYDDPNARLLEIEGGR